MPITGARCVGLHTALAVLALVGGVVGLARMLILRIDILGGIIHTNLSRIKVVIILNLYVVVDKA
jgi:hypothetical protein